MLGARVIGLSTHTAASPRLAPPPAAGAPGRLTHTLAGLPATPSPHRNQYSIQADFICMELLSKRRGDLASEIRMAGGPGSVQ